MGGGALGTLGVGKGGGVWYNLHQAVLQVIQITRNAVRAWEWGFLGFGGLKVVLPGLSFRPS